MHIAINTIHAAPYITELAIQLAQQQPNHHFYILHNSEQLKFVLPSNCVPITISQKQNTAFWYKWWLQIKLPAILKKIKANLYISTNGVLILAFTKPQIALVTDKVIATSSKAFSNLSKACAIGCFTSFSKNEIVKIKPSLATKITLLQAAPAANYAPLHWQLKEVIKEKYTSGKEYFFYINYTFNQKEIIALLEAFAQFKKWQKSNMCLVVATINQATFTPAFAHKIATFKYKSDVVFFDFCNQAELPSIIGSAYAQVHMNAFFEYGNLLLNAMQIGVPVIVASNSGIDEIVGTAALFAPSHTASDIAQQMKLVFKDEDLRATVIQQAFAKAQQQNMPQAAIQLWQLIVSCI
jgi:glycosyltransferase involved in cell wall biosynthesis